MRSQAALEETVVRLTTPGCSAAVGERGQVVWTGTAGLAVTDPGTTIDTGTLFEVASVSKQFTATAVCPRAAGPAVAHRPSCEGVRGLPAWSRKVTLDELAHHTSGIPDFVGPLRAKGYDLLDVVDHETILATIASFHELGFEPGSSWEYWNSNYILLGQVVTKASGEPLADYLRHSIFDPLGLAMIADSPGRVIGSTHSYRGS